MSRVVVYDVETAELQPDGSFIASTEAYRPNFRVTSCAFSELLSDGKFNSWYVEGEDAVRTELAALVKEEAKLVVFNVTFEALVNLCRFPELNIPIYADTMRLAQVMDNGGSESDFILIEDEGILEPGDRPKLSRKPTNGLGLVKCVQRILGDTSDHKKEAHDYIKKLVPNARGKAVGSYLHLLPPDLMRSYNVADTENTYRLYKHCVDYFTYIAYDWTFDHQLYMMSAARIVASKKRGIAVDRPALYSYIDVVKREISAIEKAFRARFIVEIELLEAEKAAAWVAEPKTEKGRAKRAAKVQAADPKAMGNILFNSGSNKQLAELFVGKLGIEPQFFTDKGAPSFKSAMLSQWGEGGGMLRTRRKRLIVQKQSQALYRLSEVTGRFHPSLRTAGTATGRYVGST